MEGTNSQDYRCGFVDGYTRAIRDLLAIKDRQYSRMREAANIMWQFRDDQLSEWGWAEGGEPPQMTLPECWNKLKRRLIEERKFCEWCASTRELEVDHIDPVSMGGRPEENNLRILCTHCHKNRRRQPVVFDIDEAMTSINHILIREARGEVFCDRQRLLEFAGCGERVFCAAMASLCARNRVGFRIRYGETEYAHTWAVDGRDDCKYTPPREHYIV